MRDSCGGLSAVTSARASVLQAVGDSSVNQSAAGGRRLLASAQFWAQAQAKVRSANDTAVIWCKCLSACLFPYVTVSLHVH